MGDSASASAARSLRPRHLVMAGYVIEVYMSRLGASALDDLTVRARHVAEELSRAGTPVVHVRSVFLPEDETCFHFFEAPSLDAIQGGLFSSRPDARTDHEGEELRTLRSASSDTSRRTPALRG